MRRALAAVFAGDARVWRLAAAAAVPLALVAAYYCAKPRFYFTGTDNVESYEFVAHTEAGSQLCVPGLEVPAGTAIVRLRSHSTTASRPALKLTLEPLAAGGGAVSSALAPVSVPANGVTNADFPIPQTPAAPGGRPASLCVSSEGRVGWGGTPLTTPPDTPPTKDGTPLAARIAVWFLPRPGARRSYLQAAGDIFARAALFRGGLVGAWTYPLLLFLVLPGIALLAVRCLAVAVAGRTRRIGAWLFVIAALNASCWALITPPFQGPDEVDHFAYVQSLVERGEGPSKQTTSPLQRWSGAENRALSDSSFLTDHQVGDTKVPWTGARVRVYESDVAALHPAAGDGGGYSTSAAHGPLYYLALAPAYAVASASSPFSQLTPMRIVSGLFGSLVVLFTFLLGRELAPGRPWIAVLAALLVAFQPMYGFVSGLVNNDVGINAMGAALELLLIRMLRRGLTIPWGLLTGAVLFAVPITKGTGLSLYPVAGLALALTLWRRHSRSDLYAAAALVLGAVIVAELSAHGLSHLQPVAAATGSGAISSNASAVSEALHHLPKFAEYLWEVLLPRLPFMPHYFPPPSHGGFALLNDPGFVVFVERGFGAFGWYDVFFPRWVYELIFLAMLTTAVLAVLAARQEWSWAQRNWPVLLVLVAMPVCVIVGFTAAFYAPSAKPVIGEFGRYVFPAIGPLALLVSGALLALGRRRAAYAGVVLLVAMIALSFAAQLLTLTSFYA